MITLESSDPVLARFVRELEAPSLHPPDLRPYRPEDVEAARVAWGARIVDEYRSVVVFGELLVLLARIEAPFAAVCAVQRLVGDELRHARLCAQACAWFGGAEDLGVDLRELGLPPSRATPAERALEIVVRELVIAETESVCALRAYRDATTDPSCRAVLALLLRDEARHAATGRALARLLLDTFPREAFGTVPERLARTAADDVAFIRAQHRASAHDGPGRALGACVLPHELPA